MTHSSSPPTNDVPEKPSISDRLAPKGRSHRAPAPPTVDVRESLSRTLIANFFYADTDPSAPELADAILAEFEVRPRGPVTEAEVNAAHVVLMNAVGCFESRTTRAALEAAREARS